MAVIPHWLSELLYNAVHCLEWAYWQGRVAGKAVYLRFPWIDNQGPLVWQWFVIFPCLAGLKPMRSYTNRGPIKKTQTQTLMDYPLLYKRWTDTLLREYSITGFIFPDLKHRAFAVFSVPNERIHGSTMSRSPLLFSRFHTSAFTLERGSDGGNWFYSLSAEYALKVNLSNVISNGNKCLLPWIDVEVRFLFTL